MQDGEANDKVHSYVRIQFHCNAAYEARQAHPHAAFIKELSFRSAKSDAAQKFVQVRPSLRTSHGHLYLRQHTYKLTLYIQTLSFLDFRYFTLHWILYATFFVTVLCAWLGAP